MRIIPSGAHGVMDYMVAGFLLALPLVFYPGALISAVIFTMGIGIAVYSFMTDYELSVARVIPLPSHLVIDAATGGLLLLISFVFLSDLGPTCGLLLGSIGSFQVAAALFSQRESPTGRWRWF